MADRANTQRRQRHAHDTRRDEILAATRQLCLEGRADELSVSLIAQRVGCTRSLFYHYFSSKEEALEAARQAVIDEFTAQVDAWNESRELGAIDKALDEYAALAKSLVLQGIELAPLLSAGMTPSADSSFEQRITKHLATYMCKTTVVDFARYHPLPIDHIYETFYLLIGGLIMLIHDQPDISEQTIKVLIATTLHLEQYVEATKPEPTQDGAAEPDPVEPGTAEPVTADDAPPTT